MKKLSRVARRIAALALGATMALGAFAPQVALARDGGDGGSDRSGSSSSGSGNGRGWGGEHDSNGGWGYSYGRRTYYVYVRYQNYNRSYGAYRRYTSGSTTNGRASFYLRGNSTYQTTQQSFSVTKNNQNIYVSIPRKNVAGYHWVIPYVRYQHKDGTWSGYRQYDTGFQVKHGTLARYTVYSYYSTSRDGGVSTRIDSAGSARSDSADSSRYGLGRKIAVATGNASATRDNQILYISVKYSKYTAGMGWGGPFY